MNCELALYSTLLITSTQEPGGKFTSGLRSPLCAQRFRTKLSRCGPLGSLDSSAHLSCRGTPSAKIDQVRARIPSMVLATTAQDKGCDAIAAAWAARTGTPLIAFTLNRKLGQRAGFARNEQLLALKPVEALVCEGSGLQSHLARLVRAAGVPARFFRLAGQRRHAG